MNISTDFRKILTCQLSWKSAQWEASCSMRTDRQTDGHDGVICAFRNFANAPNKTIQVHFSLWSLSLALFNSVCRAMLGNRLLLLTVPVALLVFHTACPSYDGVTLSRRKRYIVFPEGSTFSVSLDILCSKYLFTSTCTCIPICNKQRT